MLGLPTPLEVQLEEAATESVPEPKGRAVDIEIRTVVNDGFSLWYNRPSAICVGDKVLVGSVSACGVAQITSWQKATNHAKTHPLVAFDAASDHGTPVLCRSGGRVVIAAAKHSSELLVFSVDEDAALEGHFPSPTVLDSRRCTYPSMVPDSDGGLLLFYTVEQYDPLQLTQTCRSFVMCRTLDAGLNWSDPEVVLDCVPGISPYPICPFIGTDGTLNVLYSQLFFEPSLYYSTRHLFLKRKPYGGSWNRGLRCVHTAPGRMFQVFDATCLASGDIRCLCLEADRPWGRTSFTEAWERVRAVILDLDRDTGNTVRIAELPGDCTFLIYPHGGVIDRRDSSRVLVSQGHEGAEVLRVFDVEHREPRALGDIRGPQGLCFPFQDSGGGVYAHTNYQASATSQFGADIVTILESDRRSVEVKVGHSANDGRTVGGSGLTAVYYIHQKEELQTLAVARGVVPGIDSDPGVRYFSAWGPLLVPASEYKPCAHYLTPLDTSFKQAVMVKNAIPLPSSRSLMAVFGTMLHAMGPGSVLYIQTDRSKALADSWVTPEDIGEHLPSAMVVEGPQGQKGWIAVWWGRGIAEELAGLNSVYSRLVNHIPEFAAVLARAGLPCSNTLEDHANSAENAFCYSMHWALHTASVLDKLLPAPDGEKDTCGIDVGGSYGFLACELAAQGHRVTNIELIDWRVDRVFPWLAQTAGVAGRVDGTAARMETLSAEGKSYDFILFMGSLLCIDRKDVAYVLRTARGLLKPGGMIVLRENLLIADTKNQCDDHETRFTPDELDGFLRANVGRPTYYDHLGLERSYDEVRALWTVFAAVRNGPPSEGATDSIFKRVLTKLFGRLPT
jgi:hypothetical protein